MLPDNLMESSVIEDSLLCYCKVNNVKNEQRETYTARVTYDILTSIQKAIIK
jgi:hypothetical protein